MVSVNFTLVIISTLVFYCLIVRTYRMTISTLRYDAFTNSLREHEQHWTVARPGAIRRNRTRLSRRGFKYFQRSIFRQHAVWVPLSKVKVHFLEEKLAKKGENRISVTERNMRYVDRQWVASGPPLPKLIPLRAPRNELGIPTSFVEGRNLREKQRALVHKHIDEVFNRLVAKDEKKIRRSTA